METLKKLAGVKFIGFLLALVATVLCAVFGVLNEWTTAAICGLYTSMVAGNTLNTTSWAKTERVKNGS